MPMTWGIVRPRVLLPSVAQGWPDAQRRVVLLHELAHVVRWDCLWQIIAHLAVAIYWFNPLFWLAARRMRIERERACDDIVLRAGTPSTEYAERLLTVASGTACGALSHYAAIAMARPSGLEGRVRAILDARQSRRRVTTRGWVLALGHCVAAALPLAMLRAADRTAAPVVGPEVARANPAEALKEAPNRPYVQSGPDGAFYARCAPATDGRAARTEVYQVDAGQEQDKLLDRYDWYAPGGVVLGWSPIKGKVAVMAAMAGKPAKDDWRQQEQLRFALGGRLLKTYTNGDLLALGADEEVSRPGGRHAAFRMIGCEQVPGTNEYDFVVEVAGRTGHEGAKLRFDVITGELRPGRARVPIGPGDRAEAVRVAAAFLAGTHPRLVVRDRPPEAKYVADAEGGPRWVVTFDVAAPKDKDGRFVEGKESYPFDVRLRPDGQVESTTSPQSDPAIGAAAAGGHPLQAATAPSWPAELPVWIGLDDLGDDIGMPKQPIALRPEQFMRLLDLPQPANGARLPRPLKDWEERLGQQVLAAEGNWLVPKDLLPPQDDAPVLSVRRLSADRAIVMILKPRGSYLWHHYYECLANLDVPRSRELDARLGLDALQAEYSVVHRGIGHGATAAAAAKALGEPDAVVLSQALGFYRAYYFEADIGIQFQNDTVRRVSRGMPRSVKTAAAKKGKALGPEDVQDDKPDAAVAPPLPAGAAPIAATGPAAQAEAEWGAQAGGLRMRLTLPGGATYRRGDPLPMRLELQNTGRPPVRFANMPVDVDPELTAADGRRLASRTPYTIGPWGGHVGILAGGATIVWDRPFAALRAAEPLPAGGRVSVRYRLAMRAEGPAGAEPLVEVFSNAVVVELKDAYPQALADADVPARWDASVQLTYRDDRGLGGWTLFHVSGDGRAVVVGSRPSRPNPPVPEGRYEAKLAPADLDRLVRALRVGRVWEVGNLPDGPPAPDEGGMELSLIAGGGSLARLVPRRVVERQMGLAAIKQELDRLAAVVVADAQASRARWRRQAAEAIRADLARPGREALAAEVQPLLDEAELDIEDGVDVPAYVGHLRDRDPDKAKYETLDPTTVVVVYLRGRAGGGTRVGVVLARATGTALAVVPILGK